MLQAVAHSTTGGRGSLKFKMEGGLMWSSYLMNTINPKYRKAIPIPSH